MKIKHLIMVGLILAVLTIGAVSASDDANNLTADDAQGDSIQEVPEDDGVLEEPPNDYEPEIDVPDEIVMWGGEFVGHVSVRLPDDAAGNISAYIDDDDSPFYNEEYQGSANIYFTDVALTFSNHTLKLNYTGDSNYPGFQKTYPFNVTYDLAFHNETYFQYGEDVTVNVVAPYIEGNMTLLMNGKSYPFTIEGSLDGSYFYQFALSDLNFGVNNYTISISNDPVYPDKSFKGAVILNSYISIYYPNLKYGDFMRYGDD